MTNLRVTDMPGAKNPSLALDGAKTDLAFGAGDAVYCTIAGSRTMKVAAAGREPEKCGRCNAAEVIRPRSGSAPDYSALG